MAVLEPEERLGRVVGGRWKLDRILGQGGMGVVFAGHNVNLPDIRSALKFLLPEFAARSDVRARFLNEARAVSRLRHAHIVNVLDVGTDDDGAPYIALEYLDGLSLAQELERCSTIDVATLWTVFDPVLDALALAHRSGIVHRDLKPDNIFLARDGGGRITPKVLDFGIAKVADSGTNHTQGSMVGTPNYMSPEQIHGTGVGPWTDVWAMGIVAFECLTGRYPFDFPPDVSGFGLVMHVVQHEPYPIRQVAPHVPPEVAAVIDRALSKIAVQRFHDAREFRDALAAVMGNLSSASTPSLPVLERRSDETARTVVARPTPADSTPGLEGRAAHALPSQSPVPHGDRATPPSRRRVAAVGVAAVTTLLGGVGLYVAGGAPDTTARVSAAPSNAVEARPTAPRAPRARVRAAVPGAVLAHRRMTRSEFAARRIAPPAATETGVRVAVQFDLPFVGGELFVDGNPVGELTAELLLELELAPGDHVVEVRLGDRVLAAAELTASRDAPADVVVDATAIEVTPEELVSLATELTTLALVDAGVPDSGTPDGGTTPSEPPPTPVEPPGRVGQRPRRPAPAPAPTPATEPQPSRHNAFCPECP